MGIFPPQPCISHFSLMVFRWSFQNLSLLTSQWCFWQGSHPTAMTTSLEWARLILELEASSHSPVSMLSHYVWEPGIPTPILPETKVGTSKLLNITTHPREASKALLCLRNSCKIWEHCEPRLCSETVVLTQSILHWSALQVEFDPTPPPLHAQHVVGASRLCGNSFTWALQWMTLLRSSP